MPVKSLTESGTPPLSLLAKLKSAPTSSSVPAGPTTKPVADRVSLSPQAAAMAGIPDWVDPQAMQSIREASLNFEREKALHDKQFEYFRKRMEHRGEVMQSVRVQFGLDPDIEQGGGIMLSGKIGEVIERQTETRGNPPPEKPPEVLELEKRRESPPLQSPPGWDDTSMITLFLPGSQGTGSKQVEILLDNRAMEKLSALSADEVKSGLVDMLNGPDASAAKAAVDGGSFGAVMRGETRHHPEWQSSKARVGFFDPQQGTRAQPWLMIQSETETDYVRENAGKLVDAVMTILKQGMTGRAAG